MERDAVAHADMTQADHDLLVRIAREQAVKAVAAAERAVGDYASFLASDPACGQALEVYGMLREAKSKLDKVTS
jgi:hypothetical protein